MSKTKIEWADVVWNPVTGCTKVSAGCKHCYAERMWPRLATGRPFTSVQCHDDRLHAPLHWKKPRRVFVNSMSDLFHEDVPDEFIDRVFAVMALCPQHTFTVLTKRPRRMFDYMNGQDECLDDARIDLIRLTASYYGYTDFPGTEIKWPIQNVWLGVSCENQETADKRIPLLLKTPAALRFVSCEPLLGPINLEDRYNGITLNWVIVGGESGPKARPMHPDWARSLRDQCQFESVPFFFKQWGEWAPACAQYPDTDAEQDENDNASCGGDICMSNDGYIWEDGVQPSTTGRPWLINRVGKKKAGRLLDGVLHDEFPPWPDNRGGLR